MGSDAHVLVVGGPEGLAIYARRRLDELEQSWSRFRPDSELCRLNALAGKPVVVSPPTFELIALAIDAWHATGGAFDPTVLPALVAAGYDRDFAGVAPDGPSRELPTAPPPGCGRIELDALVRAVTLPPGVALDLGGIGKGHAADLVVGELLVLGARGAMVNVGGDLRVRGDAPDGNAWGIEVEAPTSPDDAPALHLALLEGAVATSSRLRRAWRRGGERRHHVIDPRTGRPATTLWAAVTVISAAGGWAEPLATATLLARSLADADEILTANHATGVLFGDDGEPVVLPGARPFVRAPTGPRAFLDVG